MLRFRDVRRTFDGQVVLDGLSFELPFEGVTFVMGPSGAGKSVLAQVATGLLVPDSGSIEIDGQRVDTLSEPERRASRRQLAYLAQGPALLDWLTLEENVMLALRHVGGIAPGDHRARAEKALAQVGLGDVAQRLPGDLGPGVRKRASVARALACGPRALCYDEPTTGLDPRSARQVDDVIAEAARSGTAALVVSHDLESVRRIGQRVLVLHLGRIGFDGSVDGLFASAHPGVRALLDVG
jgi:phospholipid/cholesterol/gamma-HCH transport system ATP-binding protein